jgi:ferredoxin
MNDDGIAVVCGDVTEELLISAEEAAEECPVAIIEID